MPAKLYAVVARRKAHEMNYSTAADFELGAEQIGAADLIFAEPGWSPYCIDHVTAELILVALPPDVDLGRAPFYFVEQYRRAGRVLKLPLSKVEDLVAALPDPPLSVIYSMGRCGTTLASRAMNESPMAWSLSEPEVFNHQSLQLPAGAPISAATLVQSMVRLIFATRAKPEATTLVLKLRSQSLFHMQTFIEARPDARSIFMYRDAIGWSQSIYQFLAPFDWELSIPAANRLRRWEFFSGGGPLDELGNLVDLEQPATSLPAMIAAGWIHHLATYLRHFRNGVPFLALRYNELDTGREAEIRRLFHHVGLGDAGLENVASTFDEDSQKGISIGRHDGKRRLDADQLGEVTAVLARHPAFADPDLILPDTTHT